MSMPSYCYDCDEFYDYSRLGNKEKCPICGNDLKYYNTEAIARRWAPIKARCIHCELLGKDGCPEDQDLIRPFYNKACQNFVSKKGADYRE